MKTIKLTKLFTSLSIISAILISGIANASINKNYYLKGETPLGTKIPNIDAVSKIPFNKSYADLSDAQKEILHTKFDNLPSTHTPPFPSQGLRKVYRPIVNANKSIDATGSLNLQARVNANGFVESVEVIKSPNVKLTAIAKEVLLNTKFDPANCNGVACEMTFPLEIAFK